MNVLCAQQLECRANSVPVVTKITDHYNVTANKILAIKVNTLLQRSDARLNCYESVAGPKLTVLLQYSLKNYGPTVVIVNADVSSFAKYATGFYYDGRW